MDNLGDILGSLGDIFEIFGGDGGAEAAGAAGFLGFGGRREGEAVPIVYERFLCGGPRQLNINDR